MRVRTDYRSLSGMEKAAMFMLSLSEEHASQLFENMGDEEIRELSMSMANLGNISSEVVERLYVDFAEQISSTGSLTGTPESTERLLSKVLGDERVSQIMEELRGPAGRTMWDKLANVNEHVLANYLKNEYPQTVAVIITKIRPDHAARVLAAFPETFSLEVINRILRMEAVQKEVVDDIERTLRSEFMSNLARTQRRDSHEMVAEIFNGLDRSTENQFMTMLEERNRDAAEKIRQLMFTFDDLGGIDAAGIQAILRAVDKDKLATALKGASEELSSLFFENMSKRAAKIFKEDMLAMGPVRMRDVDEAQVEIVAIAKDLADKGEIIISEGGGEDELVY
ncbi:MAG: flagellar motor switch protein FliG [Rhodospirillaceae bacterium]|nr:flagellar motor switch protein FliG [Rhodospirillaceae bacterium]